MQARFNIEKNVYFTQSSLREWWILSKTLDLKSSLISEDVKTEYDVKTQWKRKQLSTNLVSNPPLNLPILRKHIDFSTFCN